MTLCRMMGSDCTLHATTIRLFIFSSRGCHSAMIVMEANERFFFLFFHAPPPPRRMKISHPHVDSIRRRPRTARLSRSTGVTVPTTVNTLDGRVYQTLSPITQLAQGRRVTRLHLIFIPKNFGAVSLSLHHFYQSLKLRLLFLFFNSNFSVLNFLMSAQRLLPPKEFPWPFNLQLFLLLYLCVKETQSSG